MREPKSFTRGYQIWQMVKKQLTGILVCAVIQIFICLGAYENNIFRTLSGVIFVIAQIAIIFNSSAELAKYDNKPYTPLKYDVKYSALWGLILAGINVVAMLMFVANWHFGDPVSPILNILFYVLESPYLAFLLYVPQEIPLVIVIMNILIPIASSVLGYILGKTEYAITNKIRSLMFEKDKKDI